jgi:hypothetical protein
LSDNGNGGRVSIEQAARWLNLDSQTVRLLIQFEKVPWGIAYKRGNSSKYSYLIYKKQFAETTGYPG